MSATIQTKQVPLDTFGKIERALKWGWTVRCALHVACKNPLAPHPCGGDVELTVSDVRQDEPEWDEPDEFKVLTLQGWHTPIKVWGIKPAK